MYLCVGVENNLYKIWDSMDGVTQAVPLSFVSDCLNRGIAIRGILPTAQGVKVACSSPDAFKEFFQKVERTLVKLRILNDIDRQVEFEKIYAIANTYGFVLTPQDLVIDVEHKSMILKLFNRVFTWNENNEYNFTQDMNVCDKDCVRLSKLGFDAFSYLYLIIDTRKIYMKDLLLELSKVDYDFKPKYIRYIGITPSNKMFKVITPYDTYSVQFETCKYAKEHANKILDSKRVTAPSFRDYLIKAGKTRSDDDIVCIKAVRKAYKFQSIDILKEKYKTLQDVYVDI